MMPLLELSAVEAHYGLLKALHGVSLAVDDGQAVAILGANGAGKTTTLRAVSGTVATSGDIVFAGKRIARRAPEAIARLGIAHVPEGRGILGELSVRENVLLGGIVRRDRRAVRQDVERTLDWFPRLRERLKQQAGTLSGGEQQMLALARALVSRPRLLLLDEPSLGLAPTIVRELFRIVRMLNQEEGLAVLVVEQNAKIALASVQYAYVLEVGRVALDAPSAELEQHDRVRASYLGY
jgi:branched-chain amino acid transport system ATP-binding protein